MELYSTLSRKKEIFESIKSGEVSIYVCGITPYDTTHLGHAFTYVSFDALVRYLKFKGYRVDYTQNVTDIDDDILKKAREEKRDWRELGQYWTDRFLNDMKFLNVLPPTHYVKATDSIAKITEMVKVLLDKRYAYEKGGNVYFDVKKFEDYGKLSKYNEKQMILISKERGADPKDPLKKNPLDFILWQSKKPGEPYWRTPWGEGRPGWHIECSAMINTYLGNRIDIHGGGRDLVYPHHESEIAQSESFTGEKPYVKYWMHTSMVLYEGEKMSKSLGNMVMVSDLAKKYSSNVARFMLLSHHYREPWEFEDMEMEDAKKQVASIEKAIAKKGNKEKVKIDYFRKFESLMDDDLNTPKALELIMEMAYDINNNGLDLNSELEKCLKVLGFAV